MATNLCCRQICPALSGWVLHLGPLAQSLAGDSLCTPQQDVYPRHYIVMHNDIKAKTFYQAD